jgi:probable rRNA maturation factor
MVVGRADDTRGGDGRDSARATRKPRGRCLEVTILNRQRAQRVDCRELSSFVERLSVTKPPAKADRIGVCLVSDVAMRRRNREFRGRDRTTDVLAFPWDEPPDASGGGHLGDILISVPRAAKQARAARHDLHRELKMLLLHGYLHLLGYDHETDDGRMMREQARLVRALLPRGADGA